VILDTPDPAVKVLTRRLQDADVYLFFNEGAQPIAHSVTLRSAGHTAEVWDPQTGSVSPTASTRAKDTVTVKLALQPYQTELLTVR
jgi:hypothetical protein